METTKVVLVERSSMPKVRTYAGDLSITGLAPEIMAALQRRADRLHRTRHWIAREAVMKLAQNEMALEGRKAKALAKQHGHGNAPPGTTEAYSEVFCPLVGRVIYREYHAHAPTALCPGERIKARLAEVRKVIARTSGGK